jgi:DNA-binding protein HU-beta|tara:strand:+ start:214 stop:489 length:276 start_codon:yes stop_codon:yes gene_type:complete
MTKADLVNEIQSYNGFETSRKVTGEIIDCVFANIKKALKDEERFAYSNFGTFIVKKRKERTGRNPKTGETIKIKANKTVKFKPAPCLKSAL